MLLLETCGKTKTVSAVSDAESPVPANDNWTVWTHYSYVPGLLARRVRYLD